MASQKARMTFCGISAAFYGVIRRPVAFRLPALCCSSKAEQLCLIWPFDLDLLLLRVSMLSLQSFPTCDLVRVRSSHGEPDVRSRTDGLCAALRTSLQAGAQHSVHTAVQQTTSDL